MEERVFVKSRHSFAGIREYGEAVRCDNNNGYLNVTYVTSRGDLTTRYNARDHLYFVSESDVEGERLDPNGDEIRIHRVEDVNVSLSNSKFGSIEAVAEAMGSPSAERSRVYSFILGVASYKFLSESGLDSGTILQTVLNLHSPAESDSGGISIYRDAKDRKRERRTSMKVGRAFRHMFINAPDAIIASLTEEYIEWSSPRTFTFHSGYKARDFAEAYEGDRADYRNPMTTYVNKSLATSCMQGVGRCEGGTYHSVGEAYASDDFHIAWLKDDKGRIAGRVVIGYCTRSDKFISGPAYGVCEQSLGILNEYLDHIHAVPADDEGWVGLSLKLVGDAYDPVVPYLDGIYTGDIIPESHTIRILPEGAGKYDFSDTEGYLQEAALGCASCGESCYGDHCYSPDGDIICEYCFNESYTYTASGDVIPREDAVDAAYQVGGRTYYDTVHIDDACFIESLDEFWGCDQVSWCDEREEHYPSHLITDKEEELVA